MLPLEPETGSVAFEPALTTYIEANGQQNVFAKLSTGSPLFSRRLPDLLAQTYKNESAKELFGTKKFLLRVRYKGVGPQIFETKCELNFQPWKRRTTAGRTERLVVHSNPQALIGPILAYEGISSGGDEAFTRGP